MAAQDYPWPALRIDLAEILCVSAGADNDMVYMVERLSLATPTGWSSVIRQ